MPRAKVKDLTQDDYAVLADFRFLLRGFLAFSEGAAREAGLAPQQHQALLAIKGFPGATPPSMGELAERLGVRHTARSGWWIGWCSRAGCAGPPHRMMPAGWRCR